MYAYAFEGYWKDVGTIDSLWEANMDLLDPNDPLKLYDPSWKIYSRNADMPPHYISETAHVQNSMICEGCHVEGDIGEYNPQNSILSHCRLLLLYVLFDHGLGRDNRLG